MCRAAFGVALVGLLGAGQARADAWLEDPSTGSTVLARDDNAASWTIAWSGSCVEGKASGHGILVISDGKGLLGVYEGEMAEGKLQGEGDLRFRDDETGGWDRYTGDFVSSKAEGEGLLTTNEGWEYDGGFKDGEEDGEGTLSHDDGTVIFATFEAGDIVGPALIYYETEDGELYFGEAENKKRHGQGTLIQPNDDAYVGEFEDGVASGPGYFDSADGSQFVGFFAKGEPNGFGTYVGPDGETFYQGRFDGAKPDGQILVTKPDGTQSVETWKNGEKQ